MAKIATRSETRWSIVGRSGLYIGQRYTRREAILEHVNAKGAPNGFDLDGNAIGYHAVLGVEALMATWPYWRFRGDRAVKVKITWKEPVK